MKVKAQVYTKAGSYGPELVFNSSTVVHIAADLVVELDKLPDRLEGVALVDWTSIVIEVERK